MKSTAKARGQFPGAAGAGPALRGRRTLRTTGRGPVPAASAELEALFCFLFHDLRAPVDMIRGFASAILSDPGNRITEENLGHLKRIIRESERLDAIIRDLLAYSRVSREDLPLETIPLGPAVGEVVRHFEETIRRTGAEVSVRSPLPEVRGHPMALFQALSNLVGNALKFTQSGRTPRITIRAEALRGGIRLHIEDNGIGIAQEDQARIFTLFERLHTEAAYPGTGIGLPLVRKAVERIGGRVGLVSEAGRGSRFWIDLLRPDR